MADFVLRRWDLDPYPGDQAPLHVHRSGDEGFVVLQGRLDVVLGTKRQRLESGEFIVVPAGTPHTFATVGDEHVSLVVSMTPDIDELVRTLHTVPAEEMSAVWARFDSAVV
jgi:mannose-6-phosphate isomerase-like protein (cupin superfamily)